MRQEWNDYEILILIERLGMIVKIILRVTALYLLDASVTAD